jgi:hypothetical protein
VEVAAEEGTASRLTARDVVDLGAISLPVAEQVLKTAQTHYSVVSGRTWRRRVQIHHRATSLLKARMLARSNPALRPK